VAEYAAVKSPLLLDPVIDPFRGCQRQVHLDFHNSPFIDDIGADFDATALAKEFRRAHVDSVIVFAKCFHGMGYYPSKVVTPHPALNGRDLTGELIEALHREGIRAPLYTIIGWEENLAQTHPKWMQLTSDGNFAQLSTASDGKTLEPGRYHFLNWLDPDYQDYFEAHLAELLERYPVDGLFVDMLVVHPKACWSEASVRFREAHGLMGDDRLTHSRFESLAQLSFAEKFSRQIRASKPDAAIFYNSENRLFTDGSLGVRNRAHTQTHFEIESLPSGMWGYHHFPRIARALWLEGLPWLGMTGRFQRMWGDFGGVKPQAALEFECFRTQALGGANSVGDQLHPRGTLDHGGMRLIGAVFAQCAAAEEFYVDSTPIPQIAVVCPHHPSLDEEATTESEEGALILCQEAHYDCAVVTDTADLARFALVILPDDLVMTPALHAKLLAYHAGGGSVLASFRAGLPGLPGGNETSGLEFLPVQWEGAAARFPNYWRLRAEFLGEEAAADDRVVYLRGANVRLRSGAEVWADRVLPYFQRTDLRFSSHFQAPPRPESSDHAAVIAGERCVYFADPIFRESRRSASQAVRNTWREAVRRLIGPAPFGSGLKSTIRIYPRRKGDDLLLTLLHYVAKRKTRDIDVIEERMSFAGQKLIFTSPGAEVSIWPDATSLPQIEPGTFLLPETEGRLLLTVRNHFHSC